MPSEETRGITDSKSKGMYKTERQRDVYVYSSSHHHVTVARPPPQSSEALHLRDERVELLLGFGVLLLDLLQAVSTTHVADECMKGG
jgi:hypothetical protein